MPQAEEQPHYDILIIGCGPAGQKAAFASAKHGKRVAMVEPRFIGGICTNTGTVPSKTFREAAIHLTNYRLRFMESEYRKPPTMKELVQRVQWVISRETQVIEEQLRSNRVEILPGTARFENESTVVITPKNGEAEYTVKADKFIICSGTQPFLRPDVHFDERKIFYTDNALSMPKLPRSLTIVGGGIIGCEYASIFSILNVKVNLIEKREEILSLIDRDMRAHLVSQLDARKVNFLLGDEVESCAVDAQDKVETKLSSGKVVRSEMALFCTFRNVATDKLRLAEVGVEVNQRGIITVDQNYQTTNPNIYAAGDVVGHPSLASTSFEQGRIAGSHAAGDTPHPMSNAVPIGIYTIPEISYAGPTEKELTDAKIPYQVGKAYYKHTSRGTIMGALDGVLKIMFHQHSLKLLSVHVIGENATELVHVGQAVLELGGTVEYFIDKVFNYPTLAEAYKYAALNGLNRFNDV